jgi:uncharacterized membrane protein
VRILPTKTIAARERSWRLSRPRLTLGLVVGVVTYVVLWSLAVNARMRFIIAWDIGTMVAMIAIVVGLREADAVAMKRNAIRQDAGKWAVLIATLLAGVATLAVIATEIPVVKVAAGIDKAFGVLFVTCTVVLSWAFIQTVFAVHYAHDYYFNVDVSNIRVAPSPQRLLFPRTDWPTYSDFLYFSFTIGMTFQVSDVQICDAAMRRVVLIHGVVAFFYTTGIVALAINLVAGLI